jgi:hypothetical protein
MARLTHSCGVTSTRPGGGLAPGTTLRSSVRSATRTARGSGSLVDYHADLDAVGRDAVEDEPGVQVPDRTVERQPVVGDADFSYGSAAGVDPQADGGSAAS